MTAGAPLQGTVATFIGFTLSNPASNQFAITGFTLIAPVGWTVNFCSGGSILGTSVASGNSCQYSGGSINPGSADNGGLGIDITAPTPSGSNTYPYSGTFTSSAQDGSSLAFYAGPSFALQVMSSTSAVGVAITPGTGNTATTYKAGSATFSLKATVTCTPGSGCPASGKEAGLPVSWDTNYAGGISFSFTPASGTTAADGTTTTSFQPSNTAGDAGGVRASIGTSGTTSGFSAAITTSAGAPSTMTFGGIYSATNYLTAHATPSTGSGQWATVPGSTITVSIADQFGNPETLTPANVGAYTATISAVAAGGIFDAGAGVHPTSVTCGTGLTCPAAGTTLTVTYAYFQSGTYGSSGLLTAGSSSTAPAFAAAGSSGSLITSAFDAAVNAPNNPPATKVAGGTVTLTWNATVVQAGIPLTFYLNKATSSAGYAGTFSNGGTAITVATGSNGGASASFSVDTTAGQSAKFYANFTRPTNAVPAGTMAKSGDTTAVMTIAGPASKMKVLVYFTNGCPPNVPGCLTDSVGASAVGGLTLWVDALFSDAFGNSAANPGPNAVQVTLAASGTPSGGVLSATTVYIPSGGSETLVSFGPIAWTIPTGSGGSLKLNASGVVAGTLASGGKAIATVSANPTIAVTSPTTTGGVVYSKTTGVVFNGNANSSVGYPPSVSIASVKFSVDGGAASAATIVTGTGTNKVTWSAGVFFSVGLHNITFTATDSNANTVTSAAWKVLVDTSAPTIKFTTASGSTLNYSSNVGATIFDLQGDLNATSVAAWYNGTAVSSANLVVTGTQTLGKNSSSSVSIKNLPAGTWTVTLAASDLAGNANAGVSITVTIQVSFANSVVVNSAAYTTLGSFKGILVSATNIWSSPQNLLVFATWKNAGGQTVAVTSGGLPSPMAAGATGSAFAPLPAPLPSGTYTVSVFVITTGNNPVSSTTTITVTA